MVKIKLARVAAATAASAGLIAGFGGVAAAHQGDFGNGDNHDQGNKSFTDLLSVAKNNVSVSNDLTQNAQTGAATTQSNDNNKGDDYGHHHDHNNNQGNSGDAMSGDATNTASFTVDGTISNNAAPMGSSNDNNNGGSDHHDGGNLTVDNQKSIAINNVTVTNDVTQNAQSGAANASGGNNSGNATSGSASNSSDASVTLNISNN